ncbi:metal ABC transporter permease [Selenomonadales bacterium OttesenSCG-928-I06]|nr:metal ABC transporter permease [Selenomonadales bacterium OttesenSCG-928-I06]
MLEIFQYDFMQRALISGLIVAVMCPMLGMFIVLRKQSLIGDGLGHAAFAGVTGGYLLGLYPIIGAFVFTILGAVGIELVRRKNSAYADMGLAIFFYAGMALAIIFSSIIRMPSSSLLGFLFGSILTVTYLDILVIAFCAILTFIFIKKYFHKLMLILFNEDIAKVAGINTNSLNMALSIITALVVSASMLVVGVLLVSALMIVPVAAARQLEVGFKTTLFCSIVIAVISVISGLTSSFYFDIAPGGCIIINATFIYILLLILSNVWKKIKYNFKSITT